MCASRNRLDGFEERLPGQARIEQVGEGAR
jgi:hypothetical protein